MVADHPKGGLYTEGFNRFVTSTTAPIATGRRGSCRVGLSPTEKALVSRRTRIRAKVLLADEPTGNLDSRNAQMVLDLLAALHKGGGTIVMVTHDPRSAEQAQRQISLFDGKVVDDRRTRMTTMSS